jgi:predicted dehydrogenase
MSDKSEFRIVVAGLGRRIATVIRHLVNAAPNMRIVGYVDPSPFGAGMLEKAGIATGSSFSDVETMLAECTPDLLMVGSPNHLHLEHIKVGLSAGVRIFSEKPVVRTEEETWQLADLLKTHGSDRVLVGLVLRSSPLVRAVTAKLNDLGTLISMEGNETLHPEHGGFLMRDWRRAQEHGGSFLLDKCCHDFDLYALFTRSRPRRVTSFGGRRIFTDQHADLADKKYQGGEPVYSLWQPGWNGSNNIFGSDANVTDHQTALIEYENGVQLAFHANTHSGIPQRRWYLSGTKATIEADLVSNRLTFADSFLEGEATVETVEGNADEHFGSDPAMGRDLAAHLLEGAPFPVNVKDAMIAGLTVMAVDKAMKTGSVVDCSALWEKLDQCLEGAT